jgi:hypothetical protein
VIAITRLDVLTEKGFELHVAIVVDFTIEIHDSILAKEKNWKRHNLI